MTPGKPLEFCAHLARAVRSGQKTVTWKPLALPDLARRRAGYAGAEVPFAAGSVSPIYEPWGTIGGETTYVSSFADGAVPAGFVRGRGLRSEISVLIESCRLVELSALTEAEAKLAGTLPPKGSTYLAEFERQWRGAYHGPQAWDAKPLCWRVAFRLAC